MSSNPLLPALPAICLKSRTDRIFMPEPSNLQSWVKRTERMGTLMPTPRVSVPQMTLRRPCWVSFSTRTRYFGSRPAWWMPMPWRRSLEISLPYGERKLAWWRASEICFFSSLVQTLVERRDWADSAAARWEKWTR